MSSAAAASRVRPLGPPAKSVARSSAVAVDDDTDGKAAVPSNPTRRPLSAATHNNAPGGSSSSSRGGGRGRGNGAGRGVVAGLQFESGVDPFDRAKRTSTTTLSTAAAARAPVVAVSNTVVYAAHHHNEPPRSGTAAEKKKRLALGVRSESPWRAFAVHCKKSPYDVYVGRANPTIDETDFSWGNPFKGDASSLDEYREWIQEPAQIPLVVRARAELRGKVLACWCSPLPCHSDVLAEVANTSVWPLRLWQLGDPVPVVPTPAEAKAMAALDDAKAAATRTRVAASAAPAHQTSMITPSNAIEASTSTPSSASAAQSSEPLSAAAKRRARKKKGTV